MSEITIVTAFFDIGRSHWSGFERTSNQYVGYFSFWARVRNHIIVYTNAAIAEEVLRIREGFGLKDRTTVVVIDDVSCVEPDIYSRIVEVLRHPEAVDFRIFPDNPESYIPLYNYVTYLKPYFASDAAHRLHLRESDMVAWLDFGFNHGGNYYTRPEDFDFLWTCEESDKIHFFSVKPLDDMPVFEVVRTLKSYFAAGLMVGPQKQWMNLHASFTESLRHLLACGLVDDDQTLQLMAYRKTPENFIIHEITEFLQSWKLFGGGHLTVRDTMKDVRYEFQGKRTKLLLKISLYRLKIALYAVQEKTSSGSRKVKYRRKLIWHKERLDLLQRISRGEV